MDIERVERLRDEHRDVLFGVARAMKYQAIAHDLGVAEVTVKKRIAKAIELLGVRNRDQAVALFVHWNEREKRYQEGIISPKFFDLRLLELEESAPEVRPAAHLEDATVLDHDGLTFLPERRPAPAPAGESRYALTTILIQIATIAALIAFASAAIRPVMDTVSDWRRAFVERSK